jgi:predicted metal-binding protein
VKTSVRSNWRTTVLVCRKCSKKVGGGFGPKRKTSLAKALKAELGGGKGRKASVGIIETKCLGVCPKNAVTVVDGRHSDLWLLIRPGTPVAEVAESLGLGVSPGGGPDQGDHVGDALRPV